MKMISTMYRAANNVTLLNLLINHSVIVVR